MNTIINPELILASINPELNTKQMSSRYVQMDSREIINELLSLRSSGQPVFELRSIQHKKSRKSSSEGRGVHLIRVRMLKSYNVNGDECFPELVIKNSYDGSSALEAHMGIFRLVCTNGMVVKTKDFGAIKVRHTGTAFEAVQDMIRGMVSNLSQFITFQKTMSLTTLTDVQITEFAKKAAKIRWENVAEDAKFEDMTTAIRPEDEGNDLWKVFNVVQEKLMVGGVKLTGMKRAGRKITAAAEDLRINTELFALAMEYAASNEGERQEEVLETLETVAVYN